MFLINFQILKTWITYLKKKTSFFISKFNKTSLILKNLFYHFKIVFFSYIFNKISQSFYYEENRTYNTEILLPDYSFSLILPNMKKAFLRTISLTNEYFCYL